MKLIANGIAQYYVRTGHGPPLVLIHALGLDHRLWDQQIGQIAPACDVIAYDVRGHGATDIPQGPYTMTDFVEDLAGLLDALGIQQVHLAGISMGGMIAQAFALTWPQRVRSLLLADTTSEYNQEDRRQIAERARIAEERGLSPLVVPTMNRWFTESFRTQHPDEVAKIRDILAAASPVGYAAACRAITGADWSERLVNITAPTTVVVGSEDSSTPPEMALKIHEHIPGSVYVVIPDTAHLTNVAWPDLFSQIVLTNVRNAEPPPSTDEERLP